MTPHVQSLKERLETKNRLKNEPKLPDCKGGSDDVVVLLGVGGGVIVRVSVSVVSDDSDDVQTSVAVANERLMEREGVCHMVTVVLKC